MNQKWLDAAKVLGRDSSEKVVCPECGHLYLQVMDIQSNVNPLDFERYLSCPDCNARSILKMKRNTSSN